jgi:hypothetical protein
MADRTVTTDLVGNDRMSPATSSASRGVSKLGSVMGKVGNVMKVGLAGGAAVAAGGVAALGAWVVQGVKDAASFQKVLAKTAQVLKSTGNVAGTSVEGVKALAAELETMSGVDEELIINSQNVLATFTNIRNVGKDKIFDAATKSALDMSVALGSDLQGASIQVGKALNDPIKGVSALSKVGVTFTDSQKKVIASLIKTGDTAGAQKVILAELNKEFGGQAKAAGAGFEGTMARLQDVIGDTGREVGTALLPKLTEVVDWLGKKIPVAVQDFKDGWKGVGDGKDLNGLARALHDLSVQLGNLNKQAGKADSNGFVQFAKWGINAMTTFAESFKGLANNWQLIKTSIEKWNVEIQLSFQKMINGIASAGAKLPGPMGKHFREMRDEGQKTARELQDKLTDINTRHAQAEAANLELKLIRLGRQKPSPKVEAKTAQAMRDLAAVRGRIAGLKGKSITITTYYKGIYLPGSQPGSKGNGLGVVKNARGGPVYKGVPSIVGDGGREELFVPDTDGMILPKVPPVSNPTPWAGGASGGAGSGNVYITVQVSGVVAKNYAELGDTVVKAIHAMPAGARKLPARAVAR